MTRSSVFRAACLSASSILAVICATAAHAQSTDTETVTVSGLRHANDAAIAAKRDSANLIDVVGSTEVRSLPDNTVVEALRRIPGLSVFPTNDNEHTQDEAVTPAIRGLGPQYNNVTIDGLPIASPGTPNGSIGNITRGVRLDILPAAMVSQLQVVKTFTADLDPNAVGGAINIVTRSAFEDGGKSFFSGEAALGHASDVGVPRDQSDPGYRFITTGSTTFGPGDRYGITLSGNYETLSNYAVQHETQDANYYNFYNSAGVLQTGTNLGNGIAVPQHDRYWYTQSDRSRWGLTGKFEAQFTPDLTGYVTAGYYYFKDHYVRNESYIDPNNYSTVQNQTPTSGSYNQGYVQVGYIDDNIYNRTGVVQSGLTWRPDDRQVLSLKASYSNATYNENYPMFKYASGVVRPAPGVSGATQVPTTNFASTYNTASFDYSFDVNHVNYNNLTNYSLLYYRPDVHRFAGDRIYTVHLDYDYNRDASDRGFGFGAGLSYTEDRPNYSINRQDFEPNTTAGALTLDGAAGPLGTPEQYTNGLTLLTLNPVAALAQFNSQPASAFNQTNQTAFNNQDNFVHREKTLGAYAMVSYRTESIDALLGIHVDDTRQRTVGNIIVAGAVQPVPSNSSYTKPLPSALLTWHATPSLDFRTAFSQTIGRPSYDSYAARSSVVFANAGDQGNPNATNVTVNVGNPNLKPRLSTNYDVAVDWVPSNEYGGIISLAAFYKDIKDEIFTATTNGYTYQGVTYANAQVFQPINSSKASIEGVELNGIINSLGFIDDLLADFGASANVSLMEGRVQVPLTPSGSRSIGYLVDQPSVTENVSLFYTHGGLEIRAAYNRQGKALRQIQNNIYWQDLYWKPREQIDLSATYKFDYGLALYAQASNVTGQRTISVTGPSQNLLRNAYTMPTTVWFGVRFTPNL